MAAATVSSPPPPNVTAEAATAATVATASAITEAFAPEGDVDVRVGIHNASRLEWSVSVPLPEAKPINYSIDVELDIPSNAFARHAPWDQLQAFTRLDGPGETIVS